jgi:uncharacterized repeat protein (TIGR01451 family)
MGKVVLLFLVNNLVIITISKEKCKLFRKNRFVSGRLIFMTFSLLLCLVLTACGQPASTFSNSTSTVADSPLTLLSIGGGNVYVQKPGIAEWQKASEGMTLGIDYKVKTDIGSKARITFFEGSTIELEGDTIVEMSELGLAGTTTTIKVKQEIGQTISHVQKLVDPASRYEIETTAAVAAVRGTIVFVGSYSNGNTVIGNLEGAVSVIAQGVEVILEENTHSTILPGSAPGEPEPGATPTPTPTPTPSPTTSTETGQSRIELAAAADLQSAFPGDTIKYTFSVSNKGTVPVSSISLTGDVSGQAVFQSGDTRQDQILDIDETWKFTSDYLIKSTDQGTLLNTVTASGKTKNGQPTATKFVSVDVKKILITMNLRDGETVGRDIVVFGTVNDPSVTEVTINLNGVESRTNLTGGNYSINLILTDNITNRINISCTKPGGVIASISADFVPE